MIFSVFKKIGFLGILGPPYRGIGATIRIGREMLWLPYAGFLSFLLKSYWKVNVDSHDCPLSFLSLG